MTINLAQLENDLSQNNWLVFVLFFSIYNFKLSFTAMCYLSHAKKLSDFLFLNRFLVMSFRFYFPVFSQMLTAIVEEWKFCCFRIRLVLQIQSFTRFSRLLSSGKEDI